MQYAKWQYVMGVVLAVSSLAIATHSMATSCVPVSGSREGRLVPSLVDALTHHETKRANRGLRDLNVLMDNLAASTSDVRPLLAIAERLSYVSQEAPVARGVADEVMSRLMNWPGPGVDKARLAQLVIHTRRE